MKLYLSALFMLAVNPANAQEKIELNNQNGLYVSYQLIKTESEKKKDRYTVQLTVENKNNFDVFYPVALQGQSAGSVITNDAFTNLKVHNTTGIFTANTLPVKGSATKNITKDGKTLFMIPKSNIMTGSLNFVVKKDEKPVVSNLFAASLKPFDEFELAPYGIPLPFPAARFPMAALDGNGNILAAGQQLKTNDCLSSENRLYYLVLQDDGNLCVYKRSNTGKDAAIWAAMTNGKGTDKLVMQEDGNLVLYNFTNNPIWNTETMPAFDIKYKNSTYKPVKLVLENDGSLVLVSNTGNKVWNSTSAVVNNTPVVPVRNVMPKPFPKARFPMADYSVNGNEIPAGQTIYINDCIPSQNLQYYMVLQEDGNLCVYRRNANGQNSFVWATMTNGKSVTKLVLQTDGNLVAYTAGNTAVWSSETTGYFNAKYNLSTYKPVKLRLENDGRLSLLNDRGVEVWKNIK